MKNSSVISALLLFVATMLLFSCVIPFGGDGGRHRDGGHQEGAGPGGEERH